MRLHSSQHDEIQRRALGQLRAWFPGDVVVAAAGSESSSEVKSRLLAACWPELTNPPRAVVGEPWTEAAFATLAYRGVKRSTIGLRVARLDLEGGRIILETNQAAGKLRVRHRPELEAGACWISITEEVEVGGPTVVWRDSPRVQQWTLRLERVYSQHEIQTLLREIKQETGLVRLSDADVIVDVGFGVGNRDGYEAVIDPLMGALQKLGVQRLVVGGSRKVTEELHLLGADRQIGQSGVSVNPQLLLAIGISGAPQHLSYIGPRTTIVAFNRDPEAPIMTLNQRQARPRVFPVVGDLFVTVPALIGALKEDQATATYSERPKESALSAHD
jgi:hypothetical protein